LEEGFIFCAADVEDKGQECKPWNTLCTEKLKEVVASARTTFMWQSPKKGESLQDDPFEEWLSSRPLVLRSIYWKISSDAYTSFKIGYEAELKKVIFGLCYYVPAD